MSVGGEETGGESKGYVLSSYREGLYQPDGHFMRDTILDHNAINNWENDNKTNGLFKGKLWGAGQALFFDGSGKSIICGRDQDKVDLVVDGDPDLEYGYLADRNIKVSRRHFELFPPDKDGCIGIKDLKSTNGTGVMAADGRFKEELRGNSEKYLLDEGDVILLDADWGEQLGADSTEGFRICKGEDGKPFVVKFNIKSKDDVLALFGVVRNDNSKSGESLVQSDEDLGLAVDNLVLKIKEMRSLPGSSLDYLEATRRLFDTLFENCRSLGDKYYGGEWDMAAMSISQAARKRVEDPGSDKGRFLEMEVALLTSRLAAGRLVEKVSGDK